MALDHRSSSGGLVHQGEPPREDLGRGRRHGCPDRRTRARRRRRWSKGGGSSPAKREPSRRARVTPEPAAAPTGSIGRPTDWRLPWPSNSPHRRAAPEIEALFAEERQTFPPVPAFVAQANAHADLYDEAERDFEAFWAKLARERITWSKPFETTLEWDLPFAKWFIGGELNVTYNCVDRHVENGLGSKVAYHWIGEPGDTRTITYADLQREVQKAANALLRLGVGTGDRVAIYMPMIPELPIAMLACARIGAPHTVVFGGFSAEALRGRINDAEAKLRHHRRRRLAARQARAAQAGRRRGPPVARRRSSTCSSSAASVTRRTTAMAEGRDVWWHDIVDRQSADCAPRAARQRAHALPALHVGHDGQAEGHPAHHGRLPRSARATATR